MARSIEEIQEEIIKSKEADPNLASLTSNSKTAVWRLWVYIVAVAIWIHEKLFDKHLEEVEYYLSLAPPGTPAWYVRKCFEFQIGDPLRVSDTNVPQYDQVDISKRIISRASYKEASGKLYLKVAKTSSNKLVALNDSELMQLIGYIEKIKFSGVNTEISSLNADKLQVFGQVYYDASHLIDKVKQDTESAINNYLAKIDFDGNIFVTKIVDAIQSVSGVLDVYVDHCIGSSGINQETFKRIYEARAGYIIEDDTTKFLQSLEFIPYES